MKKILFASATALELRVIKQEVKKLTFKNIKVDFLLLGMGNYTTIINLQEVLLKQKYDFIVNIGVCGYSDSNKKSIQVGRIKNLANNKELIIPIFFNFTDLVSIASSEKIIYSQEEIGEENFVDMESYGVELVCTKFQIPRILLKIPIDKIGEETKNFDFEKARKLLAENIDYKKLLEEISMYLEKNKVVTTGLLSLQKYQEYYHMSFAEKLIFEKLYNKYIVLVEEEEGGEDFENFFEKHNDLRKKDFFKKLDDVF